MCLKPKKNEPSFVPLLEREYNTQCKVNSYGETGDNTKQLKTKNCVLVFL